MANETKIDSLIIDVDYSAGQASTGLQDLTKTLQSLQSSISPSLSGLRSMNTSLNKFVSVASQLDKTNLSSFTTSMVKISSSVEPLTQLGKTNLGNLITQLKKIPDLNKALDSKVINSFTTKVNQLSTALGPLANNLSKVSGSLSNMPSKLNKVSNYTTKTNSSISSLSKISNLINFGAIAAGARMVSNTLGQFITKSNAYVEDMNLFNVAMGESTEKAKQFIDTTSDALGLDPAPMMRYMGVFQMIATGFGLGADNAYKMSKNLTQLTYDISSFYNLNIDEAAQKVQSAIAGKIICLIYEGLYIITYLIAGTPKRIMA